MKVIRKDIREDEEAVSPVIGVILMVAITVILAAVIAAFVFGMGPPEQKYNVAFSTSTNSSGAFITLHDMGGATEVIVTGTSVDGTAKTAKWGNGTAYSNNKISVGDVLYIPDATRGTHLIVYGTAEGADQVFVD
ncbi:MAG: type IV pilin N-terminal domain-containing protein, partial [Candidatus Syntrophoarchaeum sp.]|nr:type IV pilin N-terminal domain-containing protein [Candidatus Syntrophoarchaeum sp.]